MFCVVDAELLLKLLDFITSVIKIKIFKRYNNSDFEYFKRQEENILK